MSLPSSFHLKSKRSDFLVLLFILVIGIALCHVILSFPGRRRHFTHETFVGNFQSPSLFLFSIILFFIIFSPIWIYRRKVPKEIHLDGENQMLTIVSKYRKKSLELPLDRISYVYQTHLLYCVLEIYITVESSRGHLIKPLARTIIAPSSGMMINPQTLRKLVKCLKENGVEINADAKPRGFWDIIHN